MVSHIVQHSITIPHALFSAPPENERRSTRSTNSGESFNLRELVAESSNRGSVVQVSVVGLEPSSKDSFSAEHRTQPRITRGSHCYQSNSSAQASETGVGYVDFAAPDRSLPSVGERRSRAPAAEYKSPHTYPRPADSSIHQILESFRFPPTAHIVSGIHNDVLHMGSSEVSSHIEEHRQPKNRQASKITLASVSRRMSVIPSLFTPDRSRHPTLYNLLDQAKDVEKRIRRSFVYQKIFEYCFYAVLLAALYFILVGMPLWKGLIWCLYIFLSSEKFVLEGGFMTFVGIAFVYVGLTFVALV